MFNWLAGIFNHGLYSLDVCEASEEPESNDVDKCD